MPYPDYIAVKLFMTKTQMDTRYISAGGNVGTQSFLRGPNNLGNKHK
jgi:hypothetical protein